MTKTEQIKKQIEIENQNRYAASQVLDAGGVCGATERLERLYRELDAAQAAEMNAQTCGKFTVGALKTAFTAVANPADWKAPIFANILVGEIEIVLAAIEFMTATVATVTQIPGTIQFEVRSIGYRKGPAGDH